MSQSEIVIDQNRVVNFFLELARQNTPPKRETAAMKIAEKWLDDLGFEYFYDNAHIPLRGEIGNMIAFKKGTVEGAPTIFFSSHFDTVEATPGLEPIITGDKIHSDGNTIVGADDKAGLASIFEAMTVVIEQNIPRGDIQLLLTICEEIGLQGAKFLDSKLIKADYGFVLDCGPPIGSTIYQAPYQDELEVTIHGIPAHAGAEPENGVSAIRIAALAISRMKLGRIDPETTANIGIIEGGTATNIITPEVFIRGESRSRNLPKLEALTEKMRAGFEEAASELGGTVEFVAERQYNGYELGLDDPIMLIVEKATEAIGLEYMPRVTGGGADANYFNEFGVPTAVIACAMNNIHRHDEYANISDLVLSAKQCVSIVKVAAEMRK